MDQMEELHRAESSGAREEQIEQEQNQQEPAIGSDSDDFFENSDFLPNIMEPSIELQEIDGDDEISLSLLDPSIQELAEIQGTDECYPEMTLNPLD